MITGCAAECVETVIDDERRFGELVDMGVASLTTNWLARMLKVVREGAAR